MSFAVRLFRYVSKRTTRNVWVEKTTDEIELKKFLKALEPKCAAAPLVRIGGTNDGGYLVPNDFEGITSCISPGVAGEVSFDLELANLGIEVFMFDASVDGPPTKHPKFHFNKKFLDVFENENNIRLEEIMNSIPVDAGDSILQMDIEGAEWRVLMDTSPNCFRRFRYMVIEFHFLNHLFNQTFFRMANPLFQKLLQTHSVVHLHANNCLPSDIRGDIKIPPVVEMTFMRNDRQFLENHKPVLPHLLDADCVPHLRRVQIPENWW